MLRRARTTTWRARYRRWVAAQQDDGVDPCRVCGTGLTRCGNSSECCCGPCAISGTTHPAVDPARSTTPT